MEKYQAKRTPPASTAWQEQPGGTSAPSIQGTPFQVSTTDIPAKMGIFWLLLQIARVSHPRWPAPFRWLQATLLFNMLEAADTLHSIGHILSSRQVGAPMDAVSSRLGMQVSVYHNNDVTPQQHIGRALGGPLMTAAATGSGYLLYRLLRRIPLIGGLARTWYVLNAAGLAISLAPTPSFDGGTLLKWAVALRTGEEALGDEAVQQAGFAAAAGLLLAGITLLLRGRVLWGLGCAGLASFMVIDLLFLRGKLP